MTTFNPNVLDDSKRKSLFEEFPRKHQRISELDSHSCDELATYVESLMKENPPGEDQPRYLLYGLEPRDKTHYRTWQKKTLIQRIVKMESDDDLRRAGKQVRVSPPTPPVTGPVKNENPVQPPTPEPLASEAVRPIDPSIGAGAVRPAGADAAAAKPAASPVASPPVASSSDPVPAADPPTKVVTGAEAIPSATGRPIQSTK